MDDGKDWLTALAGRLPRHGEIVANLARGVEESDQWRYLDISCSLGRGGGDELSDIDAGIGHAEPLTVDELERTGAELVVGCGECVDLLVHHIDGWEGDARRFAAEYASAVQLDLVIFPARLRQGYIAGEEVAIVDKDGSLVDALTKPPEVVAARLARQAREWALLGWWAVSDIAKYLRRGSLFEAAARIETVREQALRLFAAAGRVPFPAHGLTSLLDYPPFELPEQLAATYCSPDDRGSVSQAAAAVADLLATWAQRAAEVLGVDLATPWAVTARARLDAASA